MAKDLVIQDVCDVVVTDLSTDKVVTNTKLQMSSLEGTISEEDLRAGIGFGKIFKIRSEKDINLTFRSAVFNNEWLAMTQGVDVKSNTVDVTRTQSVTKDSSGDFKMVGTPIGGSVQAVDSTGKTVSIVVTAGKLTIPASGFVGVDCIEISYKESVTGDSIEFDAQKFSRKYKVEMRTIAYDLDTAEVHSDIYFIFPETLPGGDFSLSFEGGSVITPEITFSVLQPKCSTVMGQMIDVPRP